MLVLEGGSRRQESIAIHFFFSPLAAVNYSWKSTQCWGRDFLFIIY